LQFVPKAVAFIINILPEFAADTLARCLLPKIQAYFDSPEGQAEFEAWKQRQQNADI